MARLGTRPYRCTARRTSGAWRTTAHGTYTRACMEAAKYTRGRAIVWHAADVPISRAAIAKVGSYYWTTTTTKEA